MAPKKVETGGRDLISSLPDELLSEILSLLPTKTAASTSVLSKRWKNMLPLVHNLDFDESMVLDPSLPKAGLRFIEFVRRTLVLLSDSPINKFSLKWKSEKAQHLIHPLIYNALQREVLELHLISPKRQFVPSDLFFSKTLVKLTLTLGCFARETTTCSVLFPALKSLSLFSVMFAASSEMYGVLLASPLLEEIHICYDEPYSSCWIKQVWGSSIKRITIFYRSCDLDDYSCFVINTPNLVFLDYSSYVAQDYLVQFGDSLVEARLDIRLWKYYDHHVMPLPLSFGYQLSKHGEYWGDATKLILGVSNVVTLHLSSDSLEVFYFCCNYMPQFNNLIKLSFESHKERSWQVLPLLLRKSPNLETLIIRGLVHKITTLCGDVCVCDHGKMMRSCCLLSCRVKVLKVYGYEGSCGELDQMRHFMKNLRFLKVIKVKVQEEHDNYSSLTNDLTKLLSTTSSNCKILFI